MSLPYDLTPPTQPALGLIVLRVDETIEQDFRRLFDPQRVALHVSRVTSGAALTPDTIAQMQAGLTASADLLPPERMFDSIGYGCTSGTAHIGADQVAHLIRRGAQTRAVTNPLEAALAAFAALKLRRIAIVSPYTPDVAQPLIAALETGGMRVTNALSFGEASEAKVARIDPASIAQAARRAAHGADAVFLSCTNLRTLDIIDPLEAELGLPVLSSNQVLAWHMARQAQTQCDWRVGRLMRP